MNLLKKATLVLALITSGFLTYAQTYTPAIKVSKGQELNYLMDMKMDITQSAGGQEMKYGTAMVATVKNAVSNILTDGKLEILVSYWDVKATTKILKDTSISYPGKVGATTKVVVDKLGNLLSKSKIDDAQAGNKVDGLDNNLTSIIAFCEFPDKPLKPGDKWTKEHNDSVPASNIGKMELKMKSEYTFGQKETVDGKAYYKITCATAIQISGKGSMQGMNLVIDGTGVKNDDIYLDPATGVVYSDKSITELDMNIAVTGPQNMTIPMTQKMTTTIKQIK